MSRPLPRPRRSRRRRLYAILCLAGSTLLALVLAEVACRVAERAWPELNRVYVGQAALGGWRTTGLLQVVDRDLGWRNIPGWEATTEGRRLTINRNGLRGPERSYEKPSGIERILVLGDSYAWGYSVADEEVFPAVMEAELNKAGSRYEVINTAVSGWGTDQEDIYLRLEGHRYAPDLVVLALFLGNDPENNAVPRCYGLSKPVLVRTAQDRPLEPGNLPVPLPVMASGMEREVVHTSGLYERSALVRCLVVRSLSRRWMLRLLGAAGLVTRDALESCALPSAEAQADQTLDIVRDLARYCRERGYPLVVASFGDYQQESQAGVGSNLERSRCIREGLRGDPDIHHLDLDTVFSMHGIPSWKLSEGNQDLHWNAWGHRQVAELLLDFLRDRGLL